MDIKSRLVSDCIDRKAFADDDLAGVNKFIQGIGEYKYIKL